MPAIYIAFSQSTSQSLKLTLGSGVTSQVIIKEGISEEATFKLNLEGWEGTSLIMSWEWAQQLQERSEQDNGRYVDKN